MRVCVAETQYKSGPFGLYLSGCRYVNDVTQGLHRCLLWRDFESHLEVLGQIYLGMRQTPRQYSGCLSANEKRRARNIRCQMFAFAIKSIRGCRARPVVFCSIGVVIARTHGHATWVM